jgi:hypothetical protein
MGFHVGLACASLQLDIMDRGTDARNLLLGNVVPLRLGYIGVVNRSQEDIAANRSIREALNNEENFFRSRPVYHNLGDRCGTPLLAKKLNMVTRLDHIFSLHKVLTLKANHVQIGCHILLVVGICMCSIDPCGTHKGHTSRVESTNQHSDDHYAEGTCQLWGAY